MILSLIEKKQINTKMPANTLTGQLLPAAILWALTFWVVEFESPGSAMLDDLLTIEGEGTVDPNSIDAALEATTFEW
jgi:hypothetical protein